MSENTNKEPEKILITLYNHFKKIYLTKLCTEKNRDAISVLNLKPNQTFLVSKYKKQAGYFKPSAASFWSPNPNIFFVIGLASNINITPHIAKIIPNINKIFIIPHPF